MKKILSLALVLVLVLSLAACGGKTETPAATAAETTAAAAEGETTAAAETEAPAALSNVKVGFIFLHDENSTYDLNFMNAAKEAIAALDRKSTRLNSSH